MIQMPRRSVTRFFIPLVDVLILLFSMFMLLPIVNERSRPALAATRDKAAGEAPAARRELERKVQSLARRVKDLEAAQKSPEGLRALLDELQRLREENERGRKEQARGLKDRLAVHVLEIDSTNGELFYYDGRAGRRRVIGDATTAAEVIRRDEREEALKGRELYYLFLYPRDRGNYPTAAQWRAYSRWFSGVPYGTDRPGAAPP
jgi:hypothetical protein